MAVPYFRHFADLVVEEKMGNIRIRDENKKMVMIGIECEEQHQNNLHDQIRQLSKDNDWIPNVVPPSKFGEWNKIVMAVRCDDVKTIDRYLEKWFFEYFWAWNKRRNKWERKPFYATMIFKKFIWNLIRIVADFLQTNFRPVLELNKIFVSKNGDAICSQYEPRDPAVHTDVEEARQLGALLESLVNLKRCNSETILVEFQELSRWLLSSHFQPGSIGDALEQIVFWTGAMRVAFVARLFDAVSNDPKIAQATYQQSKDAFKVGSQTNWRTILTTPPKHPMLECLLAIGDQHFRDQQKKMNFPHRFRSPTMASPVDILCCGLTRMRDAYGHVGGNSKHLLPLFSENVISDLDVQAMFQDQYPSHMVEFAKSRGCISFNAREIVQSLLDRAYVEDASSSVQTYLDT